MWAAPEAVNLKRANRDAVVLSKGTGLARQEETLST
jgi:hypothetical protein